MPEDVYVDLEYQGIELGTRLCMLQFTEAEAYVQCPHPMPVGSELVVRTGDGLEIPVRVARVREDVAGAEEPAGMFVGASDLDGHARDWWNGNLGAAPAHQEARDTVETPEDTEVEATKPAPQASIDASPEPESTAQVASAPEPAALPEEAPAPAKKKRRRRKKR